MTFTIYGLLSGQSPKISNESLVEDSKKYFRGGSAYSLEVDTSPFSSAPALALHWGVRVSYEEGEDVENDANQKRINSKTDFSKFNRQIRMVFGSDNDKNSTNQIIYLLDCPREIEGISVYDPLQNDFVQ